MRITWDEALLFSCGEDGAVFVWDIRGPEPPATLTERVPYAEEILVTRSELEDRASRISELEQQARAAAGGRGGVLGVGRRRVFFSGL